MDEILAGALDAMRAALGDSAVLADPASLRRLTDNTLNLDRTAPAVVRPGSVAEVQQVVRIANRYGTPLYPFSRGQNTGYGDRAPAGDGQILLDLGRLDAIRDFDPVHGRVYVEPGVCQRQLYEFLRSRNAPFWMDATGAGLDASLVGNCLEGGFGHTPKGDRRRAIRDIEVVLGNGTILRTGVFPSLGPDLAGVFVQSNFGVVTGLCLELTPVPECYESFVIGTDREEDLERLIDTLSRLRREGILTSLVHIANPLRLFISTRDCPAGFERKALCNADAQRLMHSRPAPMGYWTVVGGIYGTRGEVQARRRAIARRLSFARCRFFSDRTVACLGRIARFRWLPSGMKAWLSMGAGMIQYLHGLGRGTPSDTARRHIRWRVERDEDMGLIWCSPCFPAEGAAARRVVRIAQGLFELYGFECPITLTLVTPDRGVGVISLNFDRRNPDQCRRAHDLYRRFEAALNEAGLGAYRKPLLGKVVYEPGLASALEALKRAWDPNGIIAPGRYGIGGGRTGTSPAMPVAATNASGGMRP
jgi:4-cresol dehydrogenase (hydroxylating)